jgi:FKBP-type peptidyl-prolyl cis-trans isomerase
MNHRRALAVAFTTVLAGAAMLAVAQAPTSQPSEQKMVTASGLTIIKTGQTDITAQAGDKVWVDYSGKLTDGTVFDASSRRPDSPFVFDLGRGKVIPGWDEGISGMKVGEKRQLIIPPGLAYGDRTIGSIPANSTLIFDVTLLGLQKGAGKDD